jgi:hypothetical protein
LIAEGYALQMHKFFQRIITEVITYREKSNVTRADFLQHLITLKKKGSIDDDKDISNGHEQKGFDSGKNGTYPLSS